MLGAAEQISGFRDIELMAESTRYPDPRSYPWMRDLIAISLATHPSKDSISTQKLCGMRVAWSSVGRYLVFGDVPANAMPLD